MTATDKTPREAALEYAATRGWRVFPVHEMNGAGCSCEKGAACEDAGKHPYYDHSIQHGRNDASADVTKINFWWTKWPAANIGVATGRESGVTVVDADASEGKPGVINITTLFAPHGGIPATPVAVSGGGGLHLFFKYTDRLRDGTDVLAEAVDVKNDGGYIILHPSNHRSGGTYKWRDGATDLPLLPVPDWLGAEPAPPARRRGRPRKKPGYPLEKIASMLTAIDPDMERDRWLGVGLILGRLYVGSGQENDAWIIYENWAARGPKFDEDRAGNLVRMREMFNERSQEEPRAGAAPLGVGSLITWAREGGWNPFGDREPVDYEPGSEMAMATALVEAVVAVPDNRHFSVLGEVRDVLKAKRPDMRHLRREHESGAAAPETLIVRATSQVGLLGAMMERAVLRSVDRHGAPVALPIQQQLAALALENLSGKFPTLAGVAEWPLVAPNGDLIMRPTGYDESTGLYFDIDRRIRIDETMTAEAGWAALRDDLLVDFKFKPDLSKAGMLGLMLAFMQRQLMRTCPAFAVVAPQVKSGKSTAVQVASHAVHGLPADAHAWTLDSEELRKALHSLLMAKVPLVFFDNLSRGMAVDSDHLAKLLTAAVASDRKLGVSETRKEMNTLLVVFTGNNISFIRDLASRVITLRINVDMDDPMKRVFAHRDICAYALEHRSRWLSALVAIARAGVGYEMKEGTPSRFEDFNTMIAAPVHAVTGEDIRTLLDEDTEADSDEEDAAKAMLETLWDWQEHQRGSADLNKTRWSTAEVIEAVNNNDYFKTNNHSVARLQRGCGDARAWERDPARALGYALRALRDVRRFGKMRLTSKARDETRHGSGTEWLIVGGEKKEDAAKEYAKRLEQQAPAIAEPKENANVPF